MTTQEILDYLRSVYPTGAEVSLADAHVWRYRAEAAEARALDNHKSALSMIAAMAERDEPCCWTRTDADEHDQANWNNVWDSTCLHAQTTEPDDNWQFCPFCGHRIEVQDTRG